jgi:hypothetical protein
VVNREVLRFQKAAASYVNCTQTVKHHRFGAGRFKDLQKRRVSLNVTLTTSANRFWLCGCSQGYG